MILGFGNTAADMATDLAPIADQVYLAHRHGAIIVSTEPNEHFVMLLATDFSI
jgi:dimethylaniline monooxygenase (N-oxide forming)